MPSTREAMHGQGPSDAIRARGPGRVLTERVLAAEFLILSATRRASSDALAAPPPLSAPPGSRPSSKTGTDHDTIFGGMIAGLGTALAAGRFEAERRGRSISQSMAPRR